MWIAEATEIGESKKICKILRGPICYVGRKIENDISFSNDKSISRVHARIHIQEQNAYLEDLGSKFSSLIGNKKCDTGVKMLLKSGDELTFGASKSSVVMKCISLKFCVTRLDKNEKDKVKTFCKLLNGKMVKEVEDCTYLICNKFSATVKLLLAIILQVKIVTLEWISLLIDSNPPASSSPFYEPEKYFPPGSDVLHFVNPSVSRSHLLLKQNIILFNKDDLQYVSVLKGCGGKVINLFEIIDKGQRKKKLLQYIEKEKYDDPSDADESTNQKYVIFSDESRTPTEEMIEASVELGFPSLVSGQLAHIIFTMESPLLITDLSSHRSPSTMMSSSMPPSLYPSSQMRYEPYPAIPPGAPPPLPIITTAIPTTVVVLSSEKKEEIKGHLPLPQAATVHVMKDEKVIEGRYELLRMKTLVPTPTPMEYHLTNPSSTTVGPATASATASATVTEIQSKPSGSIIVRDDMTSHKTTIPTPILSITDLTTSNNCKVNVSNNLHPFEPFNNFNDNYPIDNISDNNIQNTVHQQSKMTSPLSVKESVGLVTLHAPIHEKRVNKTKVVVGKSVANSSSSSTTTQQIEESLSKNLSSELPNSSTSSSSTSTFFSVPVRQEELIDGWITSSCRFKDRDNLSRSKANYASHLTYSSSSNSSDKEKQRSVQDPILSAASTPPPLPPPSPVTIERKLLLRSPNQLKSYRLYPTIPSIDIDDTLRSISSSGVIQQEGVEGTPGRKTVDKRHFKKNFVRAVSPSEQLSSKGMDRVLPKESERELQLRLEAEREEENERHGEELFVERFGSRKRGRR